MRKFIIILFVVNSCIFAQNHFNKGVNLTGWFQTSSAQQIQFSKYSKQDFVNIKSLGCDVIRLPINLHSMTLGDGNHTLDPLFLNFLNKVIDWSEELGMNLILDNHTFNPSVNTPDDIEQVLIPVWKQMALEFKNRSDLIYYEILNEPHGISDKRWNEIQQRVVDEIRKIDSSHTIIVGPAGWNSYNNLQYMPEYSDTNLIYTFHFYDPFLFTHQGASWTDPSLVNLSGIPFPYSSAEMPELPDEFNGSWIESSFDNYYKEGNIAKIKSLLNKAANFKQERNVELLCGEFGVYNVNSDNEHRVYWYEQTRKYLEELDIAWTIWDYHGGFGLFEKNSAGLFDHDINIEMVKSLGLKVPEQSEYIKKPDTTGFTIYSDFYGFNIRESSSAGEGILNYYYEINSSSGDYCIYLNGIHQYGKIGFNFVPDKDLSLLKNNNYVLKMKVKSDSPGSQLDLRFVDTKTDNPNDHPWRSRVTLDGSIINFDNNWHEINIPLSSFEEQGSWDNNQWYEPTGNFDWTSIDKFEIVAEHHDLNGRNFWFDEIEIVNPNAVKVDKPEILNKFKLSQNYPNPFNSSTIISFNLPNEDFVKLEIFNSLGEKITTLINKKLDRGQHKIGFFADDLSTGIYIYQISTSKFISRKKMILLK